MMVPRADAAFLRAAIAAATLRRRFDCLALRRADCLLATPLRRLLIHYDVATLSAYAALPLDVSPLPLMPISLRDTLIRHRAMMLLTRLRHDIFFRHERYCHYADDYADEPRRQPLRGCRLYRRR